MGKHIKYDPDNPIMMKCSGKNGCGEEKLWTSENFSQYNKTLKRFCKICEKRNLRKCNEKRSLKNRKERPKRYKKVNRMTPEDKILYHRRKAKEHYEKNREKINKRHRERHRESYATIQMRNKFNPKNYGKERIKRINKLRSKLNNKKNYNRKLSKELTLLDVWKILNANSCGFSHSEIGEKHRINVNAVRSTIAKDKKSKAYKQYLYDIENNRRNFFNGIPSDYLKDIVFDEDLKKYFGKCIECGKTMKLSTPQITHKRNMFYEYGGYHFLCSDECRLNSKHAMHRDIVYIRAYERGMSFSKYIAESIRDKGRLATWSRKVRKRDVWCMKCACIVNLQAHHILPKVKYPDKAYDIDNGITLCEDCHYEEHGWIRR